jgi:SAM-dependent methyltransferase
MAQHWSEALASWAIPQEILDAAERDPWVLPVARFAGRADRAVREPSGPSFERAAEVLRSREGTVLDVGAGAGAASLPLAPLATQITAVDGKAEMLEAFMHRANELNVESTAIVGTWPDVATQVATHDVTVVHHVVFNVPDIVPFLQALNDKSSRRVVLELPTHHPLTWMNPLWEQFHQISRPSAPIAGDLVEILSAMDVDGLQAEYWQLTEESPVAADGSNVESLHERAALVAQRLCLPESREPEVLKAVLTVSPDYHRDLVTISWTPRS